MLTMSLERSLFMKIIDRKAHKPLAQVKNNSSFECIFNSIKQKYLPYIVLFHFSKKQMHL